MSTERVGTALFNGPAVEVAVRAEGPKISIGNGRGVIASMSVAEARAFRRGLSRAIALAAEHAVPVRS